MDISEYNKQIITEFRDNNGKVGGPFANGNLLLLHTIGAKSGAARVNPLAYFEDDGDLLIIASFAGAPSNPPWFYNLLANPTVELEVGSERYQAKASVVPEPLRSELYDRIASVAEAFAEYRDKTERVIPVVRLQRM